MKFKLVENINGGHEDVSSNDILNEKTLLEKQWYGVNYSFDEGSSRLSDKVFVYAKDEIQAEDIFNSARNGFYTANKKEQSLNRDLVDIIKKLQNVDIDGIDEPVEYNQIGKLDNILSKRDRQLRMDAQNKLTSQLDKIPKKLQNYKYLIHHIDGDEHNNDVSNMMLVTYNNNKNDVKIAHALHQIIHMTNNMPTKVNKLGALTHIIDMSTSPPTVHNVYMVIK